MNLIPNKFYTLSIDYRLTPESESYTVKYRAKYIGNLEEMHPELGITHPSKYLFISAHEGKSSAGKYIAPYLHTLFDLSVVSEEVADG